MASFDIIKASEFGYRLVWRERKYLMRLAAAPLLIKLVCVVTVLSLGWHENFLRQAIVFLPSYMADGWMLAHFSRLVFLGQRWPFVASGDGEQDKFTLQDRAQGILTGMLFFTVTRFLLSGAAQIIWLTAHKVESVPEQVSPGMSVAAFAFLLGSLWAFRFLWFYIPAAVSYPLRRFMADIKGLATSFYMIGVWLVCFLPVFVFLGLFATGLQPLYDLESASAFAGFIDAFLRALMDTLVALLVTGGMAQGLRALIASRPERNV